MEIPRKNPTIQIGSFTTTSTTFVTPTATKILSNLSSDQILGKVTTDSVYKEKLQTSFQTISEWVDVITDNDEPDSRFVMFSGEETTNASIPYSNKIDLLNYYFESSSAKDDLLEVYNKLKQVFAILEKLFTYELYIFVFVIALFSQQFGGNRDLPVAFA